MKHKQFLVALHVHSEAQVFSEIKKILIPKGAHGVLLVNNGGWVSSANNSCPNLFDITCKVKELHPSYIIGINPLDLTTEAALERTFKLQLECVQNNHANLFDILWTDNGGIKEEEGNIFLPLKLEHLLQSVLFHSVPIKYYGGIAFKYQQQPKDLCGVATLAAKYFSTVITSGSATGVSASIGKIKEIKSFIGNVPLGIASGLTAENIKLYTKHTEVFIVGTSLLVDKGNDAIYSQEKIEAFRKEFDAT